MTVQAGLRVVMNLASHLKLMNYTSPTTELLRTKYPHLRGAQARVPLIRSPQGFQSEGGRIRYPVRGSKEYNQLMKAARRVQFGDKPSYRQRQASARASKYKRVPVTRKDFQGVTAPWIKDLPF